MRSFSQFVLSNVKYNPVLFVIGCIGFVVVFIVGLVVCANALEKKTKAE
jgi:hypothetical protein